MSTRKSQPNKQIQEEAAEWFVEFEGDDVDPVDRRRFDDWLRRSPQHVQAFLELLPIWEQGGVRSRAVEGADPESIIARALKAQDNVVSLQTGLGLHPPVQSKSHVKARAWIAVAASLLICILSGWFYTERNSYSTGIGGQRSFVLVDGSVIELNARSRVRVRYTEHGRDVDLLEGQALFQVAHDRARPFVVHAGDARVRAVGTQFDVYRKRTGTVVTVVEGRVSVIPETPDSISLPEPLAAPALGGVRAQPGQVLLSAGQQAAVSSSAIGTPADANVAAATAWTQRRLVFRKTSLAEVVEEFSRYNSRTLRIVDPRIQEFLISGTFSSTDPSSLIRFLREQPGMRVIEASDEIRIEAAP